VGIPQTHAPATEQLDKAWASDSDTEVVFIKDFAVASHSLLQLAFDFSQIISERAEKNKAVTLLVMSDCVIHEILLYMFYKGLHIISEAFSEHYDEGAYKALYAKNLFLDRILIPFYQFKLPQEERKGLRVAANQGNIEQVAEKIIGAKRNVYARARVPEGWLKHCIGSLLMDYEGKCSMEYLLNPSSNDKERNYGTQFSMYYEITYKIISSEIDPYINLQNDVSNDSEIDSYFQRLDTEFDNVLENFLKEFIEA